MFAQISKGLARGKGRPEMEPKHNPSNGPAEGDPVSAGAEALDLLKQAQLQRQRLWHIRRQLKKRWHRAWAGERAASQQRHKDLAGRLSALEKESECLRQQQTAFNQERLRFLGEKEFSQRQLQADRADILRRQKQLVDDRRELEQRAKALADKERQWAETKHRESETIQRLKKEADRLEQRIRNLHSKLATQQKELAKSQIGLPDLSRSMPLVAAINPKPSLSPLENQAGGEGDLQEYLNLVDELACGLADERLRLIRQVEQLALARNHWEKEHAAGALDLKGRFQRMEEAERSWENRTLAFRKQQSEIIQTRQSLESWQARLTIQASNWKAERERLVAQIQSLETRATRLSGILGDLPADWKDPRRQADPEVIQKHRDALAEAEYARLRRELDQLRAQRSAYEVQVAELNAEVERLARLMLDESDSVQLPLTKAA